MPTVVLRGSTQENHTRETLTCKHLTFSNVSCRGQCMPGRPLTRRVRIRKVRSGRSSAHCAAWARAVSKLPNHDARALRIERLRKDTALSERPK